MQCNVIQLQLPFENIPPITITPSLSLSLLDGSEVETRHNLSSTIMADGGDNAFVYLGGDQVVPRDVTHVIIDRSVKVIPKKAFQNREQLVSVKMHDGVERIEINAFHSCRRLKSINLIGVREVERQAFYGCFALQDVEFDDKFTLAHFLEINS